MHFRDQCIIFVIQPPCLGKYMQVMSDDCIPVGKSIVSNLVIARAKVRCDNTYTLSSLVPMLLPTKGETGPAMSFSLGKCICGSAR